MPYALLIEVNADDSHVPQAREFLPKRAAPMAKEAGATQGVWIAPFDGRGVSVVVFPTEEQARAVAAMFTVGEAPGDGAPEGVTVRTVEVREVLASV